MKTVRLKMCQEGISLLSRRIRCQSAGWGLERWPTSGIFFLWFHYSISHRLMLYDLKKKSQEDTKEESKPAAKDPNAPRFEIKKWNAVAMWSWDICADTVRENTIDMRVVYSWKSLVSRM